MCGNQTCPLAWRETLTLRAMCYELSEGIGGSLLGVRVEPGYVLYDVCVVLHIDPRQVLPAHVVNHIEQTGGVRLWPTLTEAEEAEMVDLASIREPV